MNDTSSQIALITGATGFVGSHLACRLVDEGWEVHVIIRPNSDLKQLQSILSEITIHIHDGSTESMLSVVEAARPDIVFHLASLFLAQHSPKDIIPLLRSNVIFSTQLVQAMVEQKVYYLVNTGTSWQHYENKEYSPVCLYAASKQAFEDILQFYAEATPLKVITLKLYDTYGPNDPREKLFSLLRKAVTQQKTLAMSPGEQLIDLVYIDDVIDAYLIAAGRLQNNEVSAHEKYAVSSGNPIRLREIVKLYEQEINYSLPIQWGARHYRDREVIVPCSRGICLPGWKAKINLKEGLSKLTETA